jgi:predicted HTH transcriptional regulator
MGTGTEDVARLCAKNGLSAPLFAEGVDFRAVLKRKPLVGVATIGGLKSGLNVTRELTEKLTEKLTETEQKIVAAIMENGRVTQGVLARKIGIARTYVTKLMGGLQSKGVIRRVGPDRGGYWVLIKARK